MPGRDVARQGARLKCSLEPVSDIMGHCFVVVDNICDISCVPGTLSKPRRLRCRWRAREASMPGRWCGREAPMLGRFAETVGSVVGLDDNWSFFPGKNSDLGTGSAGLRCRAGGFYAARQECGTLGIEASTSAGWRGSDAGQECDARKHKWHLCFRSGRAGGSDAGQVAMLENTSGTCVFEVPRNWKQAPTIFWLLPAWSSAADCAARRHTTREINESASVSQLR